MLLFLQKKKEEKKCFTTECSQQAHVNQLPLTNLVQVFTIKMHLFTDSAYVHQWVSDTLSAKTRVNTKVANEMLIRRRLGRSQLRCMSCRWTLDRSDPNQADRVMSVPLKMAKCSKKTSWTHLHCIGQCNCQIWHLGIK